MDPSAFAGMSWDVWTNYLVTQSKDEIAKRDSKINKLQKEDMKMFGIHVDTEPLNLVRCEECSLIVKAQALLDHYQLLHWITPLDNNSFEECPQLVAKENYSPVKLPSGKVLVTPGNGLMCEGELNNNAMKISKSSNKKPPKRLKKLENNRSLFEVCPNSWHTKKKSCVKKLKPRFITQLDDSMMQKEQIDTDTRVDKNVDYLLQRLPDMNLDATETKQTSDAGGNLSNNSIYFMTSYPRALGDAPLFICHKSGGLLYPGRQMKRARQNFQQIRY